MPSSGIPVVIVPNGGLPATIVNSGGLPITQVTARGVPVTLTLIGGTPVTPTTGVIQITTPAYLDPQLLIVGLQIQGAYVAGTYPDFQGNPVVEASKIYYVDDVAVPPTYVLQAGNVVSAAYITLTSGLATLNYWAEPTGITDFSYNTADFTFAVPAGSGDVSAPTILSSSPADDSIDVAVAASPSITFSENIQFGTGSIILRQNNGGWSDLEVFDVSTEVGTSPGQVSISGAVLTIHPTSALSYSREYAIRIAATAIKDTSSNANSFAGIANDTTVSFTTGAAPVVSSTSPADNATGVDIATSPTITFNKSIVFGTGNIVLRENNSGTWSDTEVFDVATEQGAGNGQVSISGAVLTINPTATLSAGKEYAIRIAATAIDDTAGNSFAGIADDTTISFTTAASMSPPTYFSRTVATPSFDPISISAPAGHNVDDVLLLVVGADGDDAISQDFTSLGWTDMGTVAGGANTAAWRKFRAWWKRAASASEPSVSISDAGTINSATMFVIRGCRTTGGPPVALLGTANGVSASSQIVIPTQNTSGSQRFVLGFFVLALDSTTPQMAGGYSNSNLTGLTNRLSNQSQASTGIGQYSFDGVLAAQGAVGDTTGAIATDGLNWTSALFEFIP